MDVTVADATAWLLLLVMVGGLAVGVVTCIRIARRNARAPRDAKARAGDYPIPYVLQLRAWKAALTLVLLIDIVLALLALRFANGIPVVVIFSVVAPLVIWLVSRYHVVLDADVLRFRVFNRETVVRYADIVSVAPEWSVVAAGGGASVIVSLKLGLAASQKPMSLPVTMLSERDRAAIVARLQSCAPEAQFSPNLHELWTGKY